MTGHTIDQCFKLISYPDWYEGLKDNPKDSSFKNRKPAGPVKMAANVVNCDNI